ncbi:hypothetical protein K8R61_02790 [bacterium]|nr:hypothetical protein [bacterium]
MDKIAYLILSFFLLFIWVFIFIARSDLREKIIKTSILGGFLGLISEFWYFKDYWRPPSLFGEAIISIEDFLFGFFILGISATIYDTIFFKKNIVGKKERKIFFGILFITGIIFLLIFNNWLGINSIFVTSFIFIFFSVIIVLIRKDLFKVSIISGLLNLIIIIIPIYVIALNIMFPEFCNHYWLLANTKFGKTIYNVPMTELLWYFSIGCLAGVGYDFVFGNIKSNKINKSQN